MTILITKIAKQISILLANFMEFLVKFQQIICEDMAALHVPEVGVNEKSKKL